MKVIEKLFLFSCLLILTSCKTAYQPFSYRGGFTETQISKDIFHVSFTGNGYTTNTRALDFFMLRSAELTLNKGYQYFKIINAIPNNGTNGTSGGLVVARVLTRRTGYWWWFWSASVFHANPEFFNTIQCFKVKPTDGVSFDADFIVKSMAKKYNLYVSRSKTSAS